MNHNTWCYIFIRTDLDIAQQIVQACHAALEAGLKDRNHYSSPSSIVLLQIENQQALEYELDNICSLGIECATFHETYNDTGLTAFSTLPLPESYRTYFKKYTLWGRKIKGLSKSMQKMIELQTV